MSLLGFLHKKQGIVMYPIPRILELPATCLLNILQHLWHTSLYPPAYGCLQPSQAYWGGSSTHTTHRSAPKPAGCNAKPVGCRTLWRTGYCTPKAFKTGSWLVSTPGGFLPTDNRAIVSGTNKTCVTETVSSWSILPQYPTANPYSPAWSCAGVAPYFCQSCTP